MEIKISDFLEERVLSKVYMKLNDLLADIPPECSYELRHDRILDSNCTQLRVCLQHHYQRGLYFGVKCITSLTQVRNNESIHRVDKVSKELIESIEFRLVLDSFFRDHIDNWLSHRIMLEWALMEQLDILLNGLFQERAQNLRFNHFDEPNRGSTLWELGNWDVYDLFHLQISELVISQGVLSQFKRFDVLKQRLKLLHLYLLISLSVICNHLSPKLHNFSLFLIHLI